MYVFGATQENGNYTFLERFAYRADANDKLPQDATELQLNTTDADGNETNGLLKLKKGLFVKLYCIANNTAFIDPANNKEIKPADFTPITFAEGEDGNPKLAAEGSPHESTFISWHTRLLTATVEADTLATPLAMAGVYSTPIDLTSFDNSARVQIGFKLTRLAARFDIDNKAGDCLDRQWTTRFGLLPHTRIRRPAQSQTRRTHHLSRTCLLWRQRKQRTLHRRFLRLSKPQRR